MHPAITTILTGIVPTRAAIPGRFWLYSRSGDNDAPNTCPTGCSGNLSAALKNNNASHHWTYR